MLCHYQFVSISPCIMTLPANLLCRHSCGAKALHAIVVDEACLPEGCHGLSDLLIGP